MADFLRLPEKNNYTTATDLVDDAINHVGGSWVYGMQNEIIARDKPSLYRKFAFAGLSGEVLEPEAVNGRPDDSLLRITTAYKHGSMVGYDIAELTHGGLIDYEGLSRYVGAQLFARYGETNRHAKAEFMIDMSEQGLRLASDSAREKIDKWSEEFTYSVDLRRMYALGVGVTIFSGYHIHQGYVDNIVEAEAGSVDWSNPLALPESGLHAAE